MRLHLRLLPFLLLLLSTLPLRAQIERELRTTTDLLDVYIKNTGKPEMVTIFDYTTPSRGVFEPKQYLTGKTRGSFVGANQPADTNAQNPFVNLFKPATLGKDFGIVFAIYYDAAVAPANPVPVSALGASNIGVRMIRWPQTSPYNSARFDDAAGLVTGVPYQFKDDGTQNLVKWDVVADGAWNDATSPAIVASRITHVRFRLTAGAVTRTIDLPCPSQIVNSPHPADPANPRQPADPTARNFSRKDTSTGIKYDPWSEGTLLNNTAKALYTTGAGAKRFVIGNFFYPFDYLSWIFGSKKWRNADSSDWMAAPANTGTLYGTSSGYAVASTSDTVKATTLGGVVAGTGWNNGLPVMTRYQAIKVTAINVHLNYDGKINWIYRFLAPAYPGGLTDDGEPAEELGAGTSTAAIPANDSTYNSTKLRYMRKLSTPQLALNDTSLQILGPSKWLPTTNDRMDIFEFGAFDNYDPRSPMPWSYALANTYYRTAIERDPAVYEPPAAGCPGRTYVVLFPVHAMNDSLNAALDQGAGNAYADYFHTGNSGLGKGSKAELPASYGGGAGAATLAPGSESFNTGMLSSLAAFGTRNTNNLAQWGAPWQLNPGVARSSDNPGLQTMAVSVGIPGSYKLQSDNNGRNPHEAYFRVAQWADPYRTDLTYGKWRKANGNPDDASVVDGGKVHYYPSSDPAELEKNFNDLVAYIVSGSAALSAPATPSTGARITSQAFFGIFNTSRKPVWSGNLFAVGIRRVINPVTGSEDFTFYGADGEDTRPFTVDPVTGEVTYGISDFDNHHMWSSYDIFGKYLPADIPPLKPVYSAGVNGAPKTWSTRNVITEGAGGVMTPFNKADAGLVAALKAEFSGAGLFALPPAVAVADQDTEVKNFIDFIRGRNFNDPTGATNRIDIMGDIINSAPLAIELAQNRTSGIAELAWPGGSDPHARLIIVGTNMGQLHCFAETANMAASGDAKAKATELWSFIPREAMKALYTIYKYRDQEVLSHAYIMDGDPVLFHDDKVPAGALQGDTRVSSNEDAVIIAGMRKGGRNYYGIAVSSSSDGGVTPSTPKLAWKVVPLTSGDPTIQKMGMSSAIPFSAYVATATEPKQPVVFLAGGYANTEVNARFRAKAVPPIGAGEEMGKQILALNPLNGSIVRKWDFSADANLGAIAGGVTPVRIFRTAPTVQRIYWADYKGNVLALNSSDSATASGFRLDSDRIDGWIAAPRYIRNASKNTGEFRFTNRPDAFRLAGNYPAPVDDTSGVSTSKIRPLTVMVSAGAGDRNNPADRAETFTVGMTTTVVNPPTENRMFVWADRQDSANLGLDGTGILDDDLEGIKDNTSGGTNWATSYDSAVDPAATKITPGHSDFFWANNKHGYYFYLLDGTLPSAVGGVTRDKILVSPLGKEGALFFSIFNINGGTGFDCSANAFTRTFRECDITRPLALPTQAETDSTVGDVNDLNRNDDDCSGLAFYFNSLSSQLADTGDRVVQGGAITSNADTQSFDQQVGQNTPKIDEVKSTSENRGFRLRAWRVVR